MASGDINIFDKMSSLDTEEDVSSGHLNHETALKSDRKKKKKHRDKKYGYDDDDDIFNLSKRKKRKSEKPIIKSEISLLSEDSPTKIDVTKGSIQDLLLGSSDKVKSRTASPVESTTKATPAILEPTPDSEPEHIEVLTDDDSIEEVPVSNTPVRRSSRLQKGSPKRKESPKKTPRISTTSVKIDEQDDYDEGDEDEILKSIEGFQKDSLNNAYNFADTVEKDRPYVLNVIPKLKTERPASFSTKGTKEFSEIIKVILLYYRNSGELPRGLKSEDVALFWIQGRREIKPFFKPKSLRIVPPTSSELTYIKGEGFTAIDCLLIPRRNADQALEMYDELKTKYERFIKDLVQVEEIQDQEIVTPEIEDSEEEIDQLREAIEIDDEDEDDGYFKIALKGKDNKQIFVKVNPETKLSKVFEYFCQKNNLTNIDMTKVKMIFDDEMLDMEDKVGDTELESDFEVQIYV